MRLDDGVGREKDDKLAKAVKDAEKLMNIRMLRIMKFQGEIIQRWFYEI